MDSHEVLKRINAIPKTRKVKIRILQRWASQNEVSYIGEGKRKDYIFTEDDIQSFLNRPKPGRPQGEKGMTGENIKHFECRDCKEYVNFYDGTIFTECLNCKAIYAVGENICLQISGASTIEKAKLTRDSVIKGIGDCQDRDKLKSRVEALERAIKSDPEVACKFCAKANEEGLYRKTCKTNLLCIRTPKEWQFDEARWSLSDVP